MDIVERHKPSRTSELVGNSYVCKKISESIRDGVSTIIFGPTGCGKTTFVEVIARDAGASLYRIDTERVFSAQGDGKITFYKAFKKLVDERVYFKTIDLSNFGGLVKQPTGRTVIFIDEIDALVSCDTKGGLQKLVLDYALDPRLAKKYVFICVSCNRGEKKFTEAKKKLQVLRMRSPREDELLLFLNSIVRKEGLGHSTSEIVDIINQSNSDLRQILYRVCGVSTPVCDKNPDKNPDKKEEGGNEESEVGVPCAYNDPDREQNVFYDMTNQEILQKIMNKPISYDQMVGIMGTEYSLTTILLHENYPCELKGCLKIDDVIDITTAICEGDLGDNLFNGSQDWQTQWYRHVAKFTKINRIVMNIRTREKRFTDGMTAPSYTFSNILTKMSQQYKFHNMVQELSRLIPNMNLTDCSVLNIMSIVFLKMIKHGFITKSNIKDTTTKIGTDIFLKIGTDFDVLDKNTIAKFKRYIK
jgi:energy-coupling factor transporter ATP-binding protein EcfA2